jgi:hypothetical protein
VKKMMFEIGDMQWHPIALDTIIGALATMTPPAPSVPNAAAVLLGAVDAERGRRKALKAAV